MFLSQIVYEGMKMVHNYYNILRKTYVKF